MLVMDRESEFGLQVRLEGRNEYSQGLAIGWLDLAIEGGVRRVRVAALVRVEGLRRAPTRHFLALKVVNLEATADLVVATALVCQSELNKDMNRLGALRSLNSHHHLRVIGHRLIVGAAAGRVARLAPLRLEEHICPLFIKEAAQVNRREVQVEIVE
eukprot:CAMPEP_0185616444 /NCGR_PEP_ID=MMETSP0436-20130131/39806_1 /TAXON_ID=626734 ORGANISM="Favella taraikaensis, Strain Fe Narragansett Bay" /NCGR_SAMPLE_ID=MMETSP0436 /ASSEMBLY_ACC=CAM_ASM_000390 /LENGTH=156 /DNA_ID=CAMNT_0028253125 /DNA_START=166 /DNA_END=636 /DNA_ORIENTATION=+